MTFVICCLAFIAATVSLYIVQDAATYMTLVVGLFLLFLFTNSRNFRTGYRALVFSLLYGFLSVQVVYTAITGTMNQSVTADPMFLPIGIGFVCTTVIVVLLTTDAGLRLVRFVRWLWRTLRMK